MLIYPTAIGSEPDHPEFDTQPLWQQVIVGNGIANGTFMVAVNRIGVEGPLTFYGSSFISDPYGRILVQAPRDEPAVLVADLDLDQRRDWLELFPFLTTRRPDAYGSLTGLTRRGSRRKRPDRASHRCAGRSPRSARLNPAQLTNRRLGRFHKPMPLQNRVTPLGELIATPERGLVYGNRGCIHDAEGNIRPRYAVKRWIACQLEFRGWQRPALLMPGRFTELFFLDEATALAAGHRPCALCRRADYEHLRATWSEPGAGADAIDDRLHAERLDPGTRGRRTASGRVRRAPRRRVRDARRQAVAGARRPAARLVPRRLRDRSRRPARGTATVITPPSLVALLRTERTPLVPLLHPSAL